MTGALLIALFVTSQIASPPRMSGESADVAALIRRYVEDYGRSRLAEAEEVATAAVKLASSTAGPGSPLVGYLLRDLGEIQRKRQRYEEAERSYLAALAILTAALPRNHPDLAVLYLEVTEIYRLRGNFDAAADMFKRAAAIDETVALRGGTFQAGTGPALAGSSVALVSSVWDFYDRRNPERDGFGRYTYVLAPRDSSRRRAVLEAVLAGTARADRIEFDRRKLNVFYVPVRDDYQEPSRRLVTTRPEGAAGPIALNYYDTDLSADVLNRLCGTAYTGLQPPTICKSDLSRGPYLVTLTKALREHEAAPGPYLVVDLSDIHVDAFAKIVDLMKVQIREPEFTNLQRVSTTRVALLSMILSAADWIGGVQAGMKDIVELIAPGSKQD
jgi:hypothetical protein